MWPDYSDVPTSRGRVGAMGWSGSLLPDKELTKRYVYRGTGEDTLTPDLPEPKPKPRKRKRRKVKPRPNHYWANRFVPPSGWVPPKPVLDLAPDSQEPTPEPSPPPPRPMRPAPDWTPLTGADVDELLETLEVE